MSVRVKSRSPSRARENRASARMYARLLLITHRTGVVCENMQGLGAKLRKLAGQAKICTPLEVR